MKKNAQTYLSCAIISYLCARNKETNVAEIAQLVEQRIRNA